MNALLLIREGTEVLTKANVLSPKLDAEYLLAEALHMPRLNLLLSLRDEVSADAEGRFRDMLERRKNHEPLQYILGTEDFFGLPFRVTPHVLIPRADTEALCERALEVLPQNGRVLDMCTGSGALAVAIAHTRRDAAVYASDMSGDALCVARSNADLNGVRVTFTQGDLFAPLENETFDLIVSNPPYITTDEMAILPQEVLQEPRMALHGGDDGLIFYRRITAEAPRHLNEGGWLCFEIGDTQSAAVAALMAKDFEEIGQFTDLSGRDRVVRGRLKNHD